MSAAVAVAVVSRPRAASERSDDCVCGCAVSDHGEAWRENEIFGCVGCRGIHDDKRSCACPLSQDEARAASQLDDNAIERVLSPMDDRGLRFDTKHYPYAIERRWIGVLLRRGLRLEAERAAAS